MKKIIILLSLFFMLFVSQSCNEQNNVYPEIADQKRPPPPGEECVDEEWDLTAQYVTYSSITCQTSPTINSYYNNPVYTNILNHNTEATAFESDGHSGHVIFSITANSGVYNTLDAEFGLKVQTELVNISEWGYTEAELDKILYYSDAVNSANDYEAWCDSQRLHWYGGGTTHYNVSYNPATPIMIKGYNFGNYIMEEYCQPGQVTSRTFRLRCTNIHATKSVILKITIMVYSSSGGTIQSSENGRVVYLKINPY